MHAVRGVDIDIAAGQTFGLVGESGSGKTTVGRLVARLIDPTSGSIEFDGIDSAATTGDTLRRLRKDVQMIFQDPLRSLSPRMTVAQLLEEPIRLHPTAERSDRKQLILDSLEEVGLGEFVLSRYPHEFSGGQRQRIAIARALLLRPKLIIADEPTSALDVSVQAQVLNLMRRLQKTHNIAYLFISHDLSVVRFMSDRIGVMYLGEIVEVGPATRVFSDPRHPYTKSLLDAVPTIRDFGRAIEVGLRGEPPSLTDEVVGCAYSTRCPDVMDLCRSESPRSIGVDGRTVKCHLYDLDRPTTQALRIQGSSD